MKGTAYDDVSTIQAAVKQVLKNIPITESKKSVDKLVDLSKRCIVLNGSYTDHLIHIPREKYALYREKIQKNKKWFFL